VNQLVVAIDGPAGAGKSTVSRAIASALGFRYVDTGAMYRGLGVLARERGIALDDGVALARLCDAVEFRIEDDGEQVRVFAGDRDLTRAIRTAEASQLASKVSTIPAVRERMVAKQQRMAAGGGVVMEGRDIGTVVCPDAAIKIFLDASPEERAAGPGSSRRGGNRPRSRRSSARSKIGTRATGAARTRRCGPLRMPLLSIPLPCRWTK